ncbi:MAG: hypothetical protein OXT07_07190 [bacterium]|nr:hypothetical protein [bacterium]MDE0216580.1 hypothetical protein [bacterium]
MSIEVIAQMATMALAVLAIIWHQQRSTDKLRDDFGQATDKLQTELVANGQRLARIEGFLGIGMPTGVADKAAGAEATHPSTPR